MSRVDAAWETTLSDDMVPADESKSRRRQKPAKERVDERIPHPTRLEGPRVHKNGLLGAAGFYAPSPRGTQTTTRQAEILTAAIVSQPTDNDGIAIGIDMLSGSLVSHDPFTAYQKRLITSPATVVIGGLGRGKSALIKTVYGLRALLLRHRRVVVIDKKIRGDEGEYAELVRAFGGEPIRLATDGTGVILNPLDPAITGANEGDKMRGARVLRALAEISAGRPLDEWEDQALRTAYMAAEASGKRRCPVLSDVISILGNADALTGPAAKTPSARDKYVEAGAAVGFMLDRLLSAFPRLFDDETSKKVKLGGKLTSFDVSMLPDEGPAVPAVVALANTWLLGQISREPGWLTEFVLDEGWHIVDSANARLVLSNTKLARARGMAMVVGIHEPADIPLDSPGMELLRQAQTVHIFGQNRGVDAEAVMTMFELDTGARELLLTMPAGQHLLKVGSNPEIHVRHVRSPLEEQLTETDAAMMARRVGT